MRPHHEFSSCLPSRPRHITTICKCKKGFHVNQNWIKSTLDQPYHASQYQAQHEVDQE